MFFQTLIQPSEKLSFEFFWNLESLKLKIFEHVEKKNSDWIIKEETKWINQTKDEVLNFKRLKNQNLSSLSKLYLIFNVNNFDDYSSLSVDAIRVCVYRVIFDQFDILTLFKRFSFDQSSFLMVFVCSFI